MENKWREVAEALVSALNLVDTSDDYSPASVDVFGYDAKKLFRAISLFEEAVRLDGAVAMCVAVDKGHFTGVTR